MSGPIRLDATHAIPLATPRAIRLQPGRIKPLAGPRPDSHARLRHLSHQLEGVFLNQLFQAMRATVPHDDPTDASEGEEMFTSMLDEKLAQVSADRMKRGVGEALYRELAHRLPKEGAQP